MRFLLVATLVLLGACAHRGDPETGATPETGTSTSTAAGTPAESARGPAADPNDHASILRSRMPGIVLCYETLLKEDPELAGTFLATLDLAASGALLSATLDAEDADPTKLEACLQAGLEGAHFPPAQDGYLIEVPLTFAPKIVDPDPEPAPEPED